MEKGKTKTERKMRMEREAMIFRAGKQKRKRLSGGKMKTGVQKRTKKNMESKKPTVMLRQKTGKKKKDKSKKRQATERKGGK